MASGMASGLADPALPQSFRRPPAENGRMRIWFVVITLAALVAGCAQPGPGDVVGSPTQTPLPSATATTPSPSAEPSEPPIGVDDVVATTVKNLRVREAPGTESESLGFLELGSIAFVLGEPVRVEGVPWYAASGLGVPWLSGCVMPPPDQLIACPSWRGWVAGANADGDPWLERAAVTDCPTADVASIIGAGYTYRLICFGDRELSFTAYWPELPPGDRGGACPDSGTDVEWLLCPFFGPIVTASETDGAFDGLRVSINPQSEVVMPERGVWLRITGHFDDPAAERCGEAAALDIDPIGAVFLCRLEFVATAISPTTAP
jgi:hypothetical protein